MQHFAAGLPNLAMALADMHLARGGEDPIFIKSQVGSLDGLHCVACAATHVAGKPTLLRCAPPMALNCCLPLSPCLQYYFNALLQLKDEMSQLAERLQPDSGSGWSSST